jgi:hypothetical protein
MLFPAFEALLYKDLESSSLFGLNILASDLSNASEGCSSTFYLSSLMGSILLFGCSVVDFVATKICC